MIWVFLDFIWSLNCVVIEFENDSKDCPFLAEESSTDEYITLGTIGQP